MAARLAKLTCIINFEINRLDKIEVDVNIEKRVIFVG